MKLVIPIAGRGSRFKKEAWRNPDFAKPKPLIPVRGYPMVQWATGSLPFVKHAGQSPQNDFLVRDHDIVFVALQEHEDLYGIANKLKAIYGPGVNVVLIPEVTRGAAETVLRAEKFIDNEEPLIISDSDHFFDGKALLQEMRNNPEIDGLIPVFQVLDKNPKWSYSRLGPDGYINLVAEKQPISQWANIGAYYFRRGRDFVLAARAMINRSELTNNEFYIAPLYNKIIAQGGKVKPAFPNYVYGLGTPTDLEYFVQQTKFSLR